MRGACRSVTKLSDILFQKNLIIAAFCECDKDSFEQQGYDAGDCGENWKMLLESHLIAVLASGGQILARTSGVVVDSVSKPCIPEANSLAFAMFIQNRCNDGK